MSRTEPLRANGRFVNPGFRGSAVRGAVESKKPGFKDFWKWQRERPKHPKTFVVPRAAANGPVPDAPERGVAATWVGHSSVVLQIDGLTYLTDPIWSASAGTVVRRKTPPGVPWKDLPRVDALLVSHNHYDHLDVGTIDRLLRDTPVFCPKELAPFFEKRGFFRVAELSWWEGVKHGEHRVTAVPAQHFSGRTLWDRDRTLWAGFVVQGQHGSSAFFAGDTAYMPHAFREVGEAFGGVDLALVPVGAYAPRWFMSSVHVDPPEAGQVFLDVRARHMLPIHWGTFRLADEAIDEPPRVLRAWWNEKGLPAQRLIVPALGERVELTRS